MKKYTLIIGLLFTHLASSYSCGWYEDAEAYRMAFLRSDVLTNGILAPFLYNANYGFPASIDGSADRRRNFDEWRAQLGKNITDADMEVILYQTAPDVFLNTKSFEGNTFMTAISNNKAFKDYLIFAKKAEAMSFFESDPWGESTDNSEYNPYDTEEPAKRSEEELTAMKALIKLGELRLKTTSNDFLRERYAFQIVKLSRYAEDFVKCETTYNRYLMNSKSILGAWALIYKVNAVYNQGREGEAMFYLAQVFRRSDEKKLRAYQVFEMKPDLYKKALVFAKLPQDRADLNALFSLLYTGRSLDKLSSIYKDEAQNPNLEVLIMREISKLEDWLYTSVVSYGSSVSPVAGYDEEGYPTFNELNRDSDMQYLRQFRDWLITVAKEGKMGKPDFLNLCIAHLYGMDEDAKIAKNGQTYLNKISAKASAAINAQKIIEAILQLEQEDITNDNIKNRIADNLLVLQKQSETDGVLNKILYSITADLALKYKAQNDAVVGALLSNKADILKGYFYEYNRSNKSFARTHYYDYVAIAPFDTKTTTPEDIDKLLSYINKKNKSSFDQYVCDQPLAEDAMYLDLKGTIQFRNRDWAGAYETFKRIPDDFWQNGEGTFAMYLNEDPFEPKLVFGSQESRQFNYHFSKTTFVKTLIDLEKEAIANPAKRAENYYKLGCAMYNCTRWGNSWMMYRYGWKGNDSFEGEWRPDGEGANENDEINSIYYGCAWAKEYFDKAVEAKSKDKEFAAQIALMLFVCERTAYCADNDSCWYTEDPKTFWGEANLESAQYFVKNYKNTAIYQQFEDCPGLSVYK